MLKPEKPLHPLLSRTGTRTVFREVFSEDGDVGRACQRRAARCVRSAAVTPNGRPSTYPCVSDPPSPCAYPPQDARRDRARRPYGQSADQA